MPKTCLVLIYIMMMVLAMPARADQACSDAELTAKIQPTVDDINSRLGTGGVCQSSRDGVLLFSTSLQLLKNCDKNTPDIKKLRAEFQKSLDDAVQDVNKTCSP